MQKNSIPTVSKKLVTLCALLSPCAWASENHKRPLDTESDQPAKRAKTESSSLMLSASGKYAAANSDTGLENSDKSHKDISLLDSLLTGLNPKTPALIGAVVKEQVNLVSALLSLNEQDELGRTALMMAVITQQEEMVRVLIKAGANVNIPDCDQITPLMQAIILRNEPIVQQLLDANADATLKDRMGNTALKHALAKGSEQIARMLLNKYPSLSISADSAGLQELAVKNSLSEVEKMLKVSATSCDKYSQVLIETVNQSKTYAPNDATIEKAIHEKVERSLSHGVNIQARSLTVIWAIHAGRIDLIHELLSDATNKVDLTIKNFRGFTALHQALVEFQEFLFSGATVVETRPDLIQKHLDLITKLLDAGAPIDDSAAIYAVQTRSVELVKIFLARKATITQTPGILNALGSRVYQVVGILSNKITKSAVEVAELLLKNGCNANQTGNNYLLFYSAGENNLEMTRLLLSHNANPNALYKTTVTRPANLPPLAPTPTVNKTVLRIAVEHGFTQIVALLLEFKATETGLFAILDDLLRQQKFKPEHREIAKLLLKQKYTFSGKDYGFIRGIIYHNDAEMLPLVLESNVDINITVPLVPGSLPSGESVTFLEWARRQKRSEIITMLLQKGANPNIPFKKKIIKKEENANGRLADKAILVDRTILEEAVLENNIPLVEELLKAGAKPNDDSLAIAIDNQHIQLATKLLSSGANPNKWCTLLKALDSQPGGTNRDVISLISATDLRKNRLELINILLAHKAHPRIIKDNQTYKTLFEHAINVYARLDCLYYQQTLMALLDAQEDITQDNLLEAILQHGYQRETEEGRSFYKQLVEKLLKRGAKITPEALVRATQSPELLSILLTYNPTQAQKDHALKQALFYHDANTIGARTESAKLLLQAGANPHQVARGTRYTLLIEAVNHAHATEIVRFLLDTGKMDINAIDARKDTALLKAVRTSNKEKRREYVKMLLAMPDINVNAANNKGKTALAFALKSGDDEVIKLLKQAGATKVAATSSSSSTAEDAGDAEADADDGNDDDSAEASSPTTLTSASGKYMAARK